MFNSLIPHRGNINWDFPFQFAMKHPDLHCFVTNNISMVPYCQSPLRGPAIASSTSEPYTAAPGILVHQRWQSSPSRKRSYYPHFSHLTACISSAALSRVIGLTWLIDKNSLFIDKNSLFVGRSIGILSLCVKHKMPAWCCGWRPFVEFVGR